MPKWTPEQEAEYALSYGSQRSSLSKPAQLAYDQLLQERLERAQERPVTSSHQAAEQQQSDQDLSCSGCGAELTPNARFCASCGKPIQDTNCSGCGTELTPNARFCASCGKPIGQSYIQNKDGRSSPSGEEKIQEFDVKYVTFYDGSGHRLGPSRCTLTTRRLIINDVRGGIHQIQLRDISGVDTPSKLAAPKMLRIRLLASQAYDIDCVSKDQKLNLEVWLSEAIQGSFS
jgi:hypothetical protein